MYILSALPGSGKDAHIRMHYRNLPILSLDDIRRAAGIDPTDKKKVTVASSSRRKNRHAATYAPASQPARKLMDAKYADDASIFPSKEIMEKSFIVSPKSSVASKLSVRLWQGLKAGR